MTAGHQMERKSGRRYGIVIDSGIYPEHYSKKRPRLVERVVLVWLGVTFPVLVETFRAEDQEAYYSFELS